MCLISARLCSGMFKFLAPAILLLLSVSVHGLLLVLPLPERTAEEPETLSRDEEALLQQEAIAVSDLPVVEAPPEPPPQSPEAATPPPGAEVAAATPAPANQATPRSPAPPVPEQRDLDNLPEEDELPIEDGLDAETDDPGSEDPEEIVAFSPDFPHYEGAEGGCYGITACQRVRGVGSYRNVARGLVPSFEARGYAVTLREDLEDTGRQVYEMQSLDDGSTQYLMVFSDLDGSAVYVVSTRILSLNDLKTLQDVPPARSG